MSEFNSNPASHPEQPAEAPEEARVASSGEDAPEAAPLEDALAESAPEPDTQAEAADAANAGDEAQAPVADGEVLPDGDGAAAPEAGTEAAPADKAAEYLALAQRTQADFDNFRKRAARDAAAAQQRGIAKLAKELLPALDNLERAIEHAPAEDPLLQGIKLVQADLLGALTRAGIESFSPAGEQFDPQHHEAVAQMPKEGVAAGTVAEVYQQGYRLGDTVLRPARVAVAA